MTATPQREREGIGKGELKDAKWELQRCGILLEGSREREVVEGGLQRSEGKQGRGKKDLKLKEQKEREVRKLQPYTN